MATSPNFSWPEPDNTDLVKNGALAIRTAVDAIDSSMVDLKGGTTGQILAKTSNTDMDFTWVANDVGDITGVTATTPLTGGGTSGAITVGIQDATTSVKGAVQLSDSTSTTSSILAATPTAVKAAFDLATTANANNNATMIQQYTATESVLKNIPSRVPVAEQLLKQAVYWIDAAQSDNSDQVLDNQGWGAPALTTQLGSSASADSNDPKFLDFDGTNYVYTPGVTANCISTPDAAALDITGDIDVRLQIAMDDWTPAALTCVLSKYFSTNASYAFYVNTDGTLGTNISTNGTSAVDALAVSKSTAATGITDGTSKWIRFVVDVNNGASGHDYKYFTSNDGITWTQLGTTVTVAGTTSIFSGTASVLVGAFGDVSATQYDLAGKIYRAQILDGIDGTKVLDVNTSVIGSGSATSFSALTGQTVTINRSTSGKKTAVVTHPVWLFGTDDYMQVADNDLLDFNATDNFTICFVGRRFATQSANQTQIAKTSFWSSTAQAGYALHNANFNYSDGTTNLNVGSVGATGTLETMSVIRNKSTNQSFFYLNGVLAGTTSDTIGSLTNSLTFFIGKSNTGGYEADMEFIAAAVFRRVLTATEITTINNYYNARVGA